MNNPTFGIMPLIKQFPLKIGFTWLFLILENALMALIPLFIGQAIDGLLNADNKPMWWLAACLIGLILVSVLRRIYDTRAYGDIRIQLGLNVSDKHADQDVSVTNARVSMARELVDFLEEQLPDLITAKIQLIVAIIILYSFEMQLAANALILIVLMALVYALFHQRFISVNKALNDQSEKQVTILASADRRGLIQHFKVLRNAEIKLSDSDAILYGVIFLLISSFLVTNLWLATHFNITSAGQIFSVVSYSWEFSEAAVALPMAMQQMARLDEISNRLNQFSSGSAKEA